MKNEEWPESRLNVFVRALVFWLSLLELLAGWRGWRGLAWLGGRQRLLLPLPPAALLGMRASWGWRVASLILALLPALLLQVAASSLRNRALDPQLRLRSGRYDDRDVEGLHIPMDEGYLPALHIVPRSGAAAAVCVLHGSGDHKTAYTWWLADALLAQGLAVLLIDLDGHGENPRAQSFPEIAEDVMVAARWLRERYAGVGVLGISLGGCVAARAVADGADVDALVVLEAPPVLSFTRADMRREAMALAQPRLLDLFSDCTVEQIVRTWLSAPIRARISTWDLIAGLDLLGSLPRIAVPILLLYGANDAIVKPAQAEQVRRAAPPGARFRLVPRASHLTLILDRELLREIGEWLAGILFTSRYRGIAVE
jgi:alpha-beta hydrolase superfamily lysophospholipase